MRQLRLEGNLPLALWTVLPIIIMRIYVSSEWGSEEDSFAPIGRYYLSRPKPKRGLQVIVDAFSVMCLVVAVTLPVEIIAARNFTPAALAWVGLSLFGFLICRFLKPK